MAGFFITSPSNINPGSAIFLYQTAKYINPFHFSIDLTIQIFMFENFIAPSTAFMNVVIIEDEVELGQLIQIFLKKQFLAHNKSEKGEIRTATSIEDGIKHIDELHPEWIFLDNNLPDGRGLDLLVKLKRGAFAPKVIMMSAMTNIRQQALRQGADYFMDKPISFSEIKRIMGGVSPSENYG